MATLSLSSPAGYSGGSSQTSGPFVGYASGKNYVLRYSFKTPYDKFITSVTFSTRFRHYDGSYVNGCPIHIKITDSSTSHKNAGYNSAYDAEMTGSGEVIISGLNLKPHTTYYIYLFPGHTTYSVYYCYDNNGYDYASAVYESTSAEYKLSINAGDGSSILVDRTYSNSGLTEPVLDGDTVYYNDLLKIIFSVNQNYKLLSNTVNNLTFISGNTYTVTGDVTITSVAQPLVSDIGATDADIGSTSTITITKYDRSYTHTITYAFGDATGTICTKSGHTSIAWTVPTSFYEQIPSDSSGVCTLTITTYNGDTPLGRNTCTMTVTAASTNCAPDVDGTVVDVNATTVALTGDSSVIIRYKSTAQCTMVATPKNYASISSVRIGEMATTGTESNGVVTATRSYAGTSYTSYDFSATDSRGYTTSITANPTVIAYVQLTCNPVITRPTPTGSSIVMSVAGTLYRGSLGAVSNSLILDYRYKTLDGTYSSWMTVDPSNIILGTYKYTVTNLSLGEDFDYKTSYVFQVRARDGSSDYTLSTVTKTVNVQKGIPVFDWGENDFNVNGDLRLNNISILDIMYPVGSVYMHSSDIIPASISTIGTWTSVETGVDGLHAWRRTI